jgi:hypothetical protein
MKKAPNKSPEIPNSSRAGSVNQQNETDKSTNSMVPHVPPTTHKDIEEYFINIRNQEWQQNVLDILHSLQVNNDQDF